MKEHMSTTNLHFLLESLIGADPCAELFAMIDVPSSSLRATSDQVSRLELAQALNILLFATLLKNVPEGHAYVKDAMAAGRKIHFDHGALRTVLGKNTGSLPPGEVAITRVLIPLGYRQNGLYPLPRIKMTGRAYAHIDDPEGIAQFFVSEFHPEEFSPRFQEAVDRILSTSKDPLDASAKHLLTLLAEQQQLTRAQALSLLPALLNCFTCQHEMPALEDYETLLAESSEMAWISTEGTTFNHATDRVDNVEQVADMQRKLGRTIKEKIEKSRNGRVRQTAFRATAVLRTMKGRDGNLVERKVPGAFYEFISRDRFVDDETQCEKLDLTFDSGNAQGIFKMTESVSSSHISSEM